MGKFFSKLVENHIETLKIIRKNFDSNYTALTFALPLKKGWQVKAKRSLKVGKQ